MIKQLVKKSIKKVFSISGYELVDIKHSYTKNKQPKINPPANLIIGGGNRSYGPEWHNLEYATIGYQDKYKNLSNNIDINHDLTSSNPFPIASNSINKVYSSHVIEHLKEEHTFFIFKEIYRVLKKDGIFRLSCPDIDLYIRAFMNKDIDFFHYRDHPHYRRMGIQNSISGLFIDVFATGNQSIDYTDDQLRYLIDQNGVYNTLDSLCKQTPYNPEQSHFHVSWYNYEKIFNMLTQAGFDNIYKCALGQSANESFRNLNIFDMGDPKISLFVECKK